MVSSIYDFIFFGTTQMFIMYTHGKSNKTEILKCTIDWDHCTYRNHTE